MFIIHIIQIFKYIHKWKSKNSFVILNQYIDVTARKYNNVIDIKF